ncbi:hypothetical protein D3C72_2059250 [compost metagenome]
MHVVTYSPESKRSSSHFLTAFNPQSVASASVVNVGSSHCNECLSGRGSARYVADPAGAKRPSGSRTAWLSICHLSLIVIALSIRAFMVVNPPGGLPIADLREGITGRTYQNFHQARRGQRSLLAGPIS